MLLLLGAVVLLAIMFWARANPPELTAEEDPLGAACNAVSRYFGMEIEPLPSVDGGLRVTSVHEGGPAALAGMQVDDHIVACGERSVWNASELVDYFTEISSRYGRATMMIKRGEQYLVVGFGLDSSQPGGHDHGGGRS